MSELTPQPVKISFPQVTAREVESFSKVWNAGGISVILDPTAKRFALDFSNIVLRSYVLGQMEAAKKAQAMQAQQGQQTSPPTSPAPEPGRIVLA